MNAEDPRALEQRLAAACAAWNRPELTPVLLSGSRAWPVRCYGGRFMVAQPVVEVLNDAQLEALAGYHLTRSPAMTARAWSPYLPMLLPVAFFFPAIRWDLDPVWIFLPLGMMLANVVVLLNPGTYSWAESPRIRAFAARGGNLGDLAAALWRLTVINWGGTPSLALAAILFRGVATAMARQSGTSIERLLSLGGVDVSEASPSGSREPERPKTWWQRNKAWVQLVLMLAVLLALRFFRERR